MSRNQLLGKLHIAKKELGFDDETYRGILFERCGKTSAKDLSDRQISSVIREFVSKGWTPRASRLTPDAKKFDDQVGDIYSATPAQKRMIEAMWHDVYRGNDEAKHLRQFLWNHFKTSDLRFLEKRKASDVIEAIKAIKTRKTSDVKRGKKEDGQGALEEEKHVRESRADLPQVRQAF
jgi:hypothetical protein